MLLSLMTITRVRESDHPGWKAGGAVTHVLVNDPTRGYGFSLKICWPRRDKTVPEAVCLWHFYLLYAIMNSTRICILEF